MMFYSLSPRIKDGSKGIKEGNVCFRVYRFNKCIKKYISDKIKKYISNNKIEESMVYIFYKYPFPSGYVYKRPP